VSIVVYLVGVTEISDHIMALSLRFSIVIACLYAMCCQGYHYHHASRIQTSLPPLGLFGNLFKGGSNNINKPAASSAPSVKVAADSKRVEDLKKNLEKISRTQNRDYEAEARANIKPKEIADKQSISYNFAKANEFPNLYKGWIKSDGGQIESQMVKATKAALGKGVKYMEVLFDPVPNLDEVAFGTAWNQKLRKEVSSTLKVPEYACNRGGPATLEWSNIYSASQLARGVGRKKVVALSISGEGCKGQFLPTLTKGMQLLPLKDTKRKDYLEGQLKGTDLVIVLSPCQESHYIDAKSVGDALGCPVLALNSPYSYRYDIGGGKPFELAYVMKRIPKGWIFRQFPGAFEAIIEGPNYEVFKADKFDAQPSLPVITKVSMAASANKYGAAGNDRIFQNRL